MKTHYTNTRSQNYAIASAMRFRRLNSKFHGEILKAAECYVRWWDVVQEPKPDLGKFLRLASAIQSKQSKIKLLWRTLRKGRDIRHSTLALYARFCAELLGDRKKAARLRTKYWENAAAAAIQEAETPEGVVRVSGQEGTKGTILSYNRAFSQMTGYLPDELAGRKVDSLIPELYRVDFLASLEKLAKDVTTSGGAEWRTEGFVTHKSGFMVHVAIKAAKIPQISDVIATVTLAKENYTVGYMIIAGDGAIQGITSSIWLRLSRV